MRVLTPVTDETVGFCQLLSSHHFPPLWPQIILKVAFKIVLGPEFPVWKPFSEVDATEGS